MLDKLYRVLVLLKTKLFYSLLLSFLGSRSVVLRPIYWTPKFISIGNSVYIWPGCRIEAISKYEQQRFSPKIVFEDGVSLQQRCHITAAGSLVIGKNTLISFDVSIQDTDHAYQQIGVPIAKQPLIVKETRIGENCFIGSGAKIQAGTILGKQCIVGTNAVVRGHFPDYCVIVGVPARIVKRYNPKTEQWEKTNASGEFLSEL
jgi:acetyltransferase-like isoleucine patch superfamily enzyme